MSDYIKRENAKRAVWGCTRDTGIDEAPFEYAEGLLEDVPAEDVAPVVRCADCKWYGDENRKIFECCTYWAQDGGVLIPTKFIDFCRYGERKDNEID